MNRDDVYYQAMLSRDYRFDGRFFVGVKTTGIYCRPICPARPRRENTEFFNSAPAAERAGYRPCLRCRPESAPQSPAWSGTSSIVRRALRLISTGDRLALNETRFADALGVSARHLRRLFESQVGRSPKQIADAQRLGFARSLVVETSLPLTEVADAAGFASLRRFNSSFKERFHRTPSDLRKKRASGSDTRASIDLTLAYRPPFDFESVLSFQRRHAMQGLEIVTDRTYTRLARVQGSIVEFEVSEEPARPALRLRVFSADARALFELSQTVRAMFDLDADPLLIRQALERTPQLRDVLKKRPGTRVARGFDPFETSVATILGQLVSTQQAGRLVADLIREYGVKTRHPRTGEEFRLFPTASALSKCDLLKVRTTQGRRRAIRSLAAEVASGRLKLAPFGDIEAIKAQLLALPGIGPWSAEYIGLRALGDTDSYPATDLILKRASGGSKASNLDTTRPWRSYAAVHLWRNHDLACEEN